MNGVGSRGLLSDEIDRLLAAGPRAANELLAAGREAQHLGMAAEEERAVEGLVAILLRAIEARALDMALEVEAAIYQFFVKAVEDEDHYERRFARWREPLAQLGRSLSPGPCPAVARAGPRRIAFVMATGVVLGHTEVLYRLLEKVDRTRFEPVIYVFTASQPDFVEGARRLGVRVADYPQPPRADGMKDGYLARFAWLRRQIAEDGAGVAVWVSVPTAASFAFAYRIAPVQVMWTLRYHPIRQPEVAGYLTYGSWGEAERVFHGQRWTVCPVPLALDPRPPAPEAVAALRARFPQPVLVGTLARAEKIASRPFLEAVAALLEREPECGYVWTGHERHGAIQSFFEARGLAARCHFVGWVDTPLYAAMLDLFLETFPLGCGITGYQALAAGVPLLSYLEPNTVLGMQSWRELMERAGDRDHVSRELLDEYPVLAARTPGEYAELAQRMLRDAAFRESWRERERGFFATEIAGIERYAERFFGAVESIAERHHG